jgi:hypothetical protein
MKRSTLVLAAPVLMLGGVGQAKAGWIPPGGGPTAGSGGGVPGGPDPLYSFTFSDTSLVRMALRVSFRGFVP